MSTRAHCFEAFLARKYHGMQPKRCAATQLLWGDRYGGVNAIQRELEDQGNKSCLLHPVLYPHPLTQ